MREREREREREKTTSYNILMYNNYMVITTLHSEYDNYSTSTKFLVDVEGKD